MNKVFSLFNLYYASGRPSGMGILNNLAEHYYCVLLKNNHDTKLWTVFRFNDTTSVMIIGRDS